MIVKCQYYEENLNQNDVKLARKSLMLSDEMTLNSPSEGFKFLKINSNQNSDKGLMPNGSLRMRGRQPSEATKLRALCFLKLFLLISMV